MSKAILSVLALIAYSTNFFAQDLPMLTQVSIGGNGDEYFTKIVASPTDDGYYAVGAARSFATGNKTCQGYGGEDYWLIKLNHNFSVEWDRCIGGGTGDLPNDLLILDNKIYIGGTSRSGGNGNKTTANFGLSDIWLVCLDLSGNILWQTEYGGSGYDVLSMLFDYSANTILLGSQSNSNISGNKTESSIGSSDVWLVEINKADGAIIRQKTLGSNVGEGTAMIYNSPANTHYLVTTSHEGASDDKVENGYGDDDIWLMEIDHDFNILKSKILGGSSSETEPFLVQDGTNIYLASTSFSHVSGNKTVENASSGACDTWLIKLDLDVNIIWDKVYGGNSNDIPTNMELTSHDQLLLSMKSHSSQNSGNKTAPAYGSDDSWSVILTKDGNIFGEMSYGGSSADYGVITKIGNEYIFGGSSESVASGVKEVSTTGLSDFWLGKLDLEPILGTISNSPNHEISVYPNPFSSEATFNLSAVSEPLILNVYTMDGRLVKSENIPAEIDTYILHLPENNIYNYQLKGGKINVTGKIVKM